MSIRITENSWLICKGHLNYSCDFIREYKHHTNPTMKISMHIFSTCKQYGYKCIHVSRVTYKRLAYVHSLLVLQDLPINLKGLHVLYDTLTCTLHVYKPTVQPVASRRLFFDVQVVTFLLREYTLFARANLFN